MIEKNFWMAKMALETLKQEFKVVIWKCHQCGKDRACEYKFFMPARDVDYWTSPGKDGKPKLVIQYFGCPLPGEINPYPSSRWILDRVVDPIQEIIEKNDMQFCKQRLDLIAKYCRIQLNKGLEHFKLLGIANILKIIDGSYKPRIDD